MAQPLTLKNRGHFQIAAKNGTLWQYVKILITVPDTEVHCAPDAKNRTVNRKWKRNFSIVKVQVRKQVLISHSSLEL